MLCSFWEPSAHLDVTPGYAELPPRDEIFRLEVARSAGLKSAQAAGSAGNLVNFRLFICAATLAVHPKGTTMADNKNDKGDKKSGSDKKSGQGSGKK